MQQKKIDEKQKDEQWALEEARRKLMEFLRRRAEGGWW